jgi:hypothetical protein
MKNTQHAATEQSSVQTEETPLPADVESAEAKLVYLYLRGRTESTVEELRAALRMKAITLYPVLGNLAEMGYVRYDGDRYVCE